MKFISNYKRELMLLFIMLILFSVVVIAAKNNIEKNKDKVKDNMGKCINDCVHAYNPPTNDGDALKQYPVTGFMAKICVDACKAETHTLGGCSEEGGDCCNVFREDVDPDCRGEDYCGSNSDCQEFYYCDTESSEPTCKAKLWPPYECDFDYQCISNYCGKDPATGQGYC